MTLSHLARPAAALVLATLAAFDARAQDDDTGMSRSMGKAAAAPLAIALDTSASATPKREIAAANQATAKPSAAPRDSSAWITPVSTWTHQAAESGHGAFVSHSGGATIGMDGKLDGPWKIGGNLTYLSTRMSSRSEDGGHSRSDIDTYVGTMTATYRGQPWFAVAVLSAGLSEVDAVRYAQTTTGAVRGHHYNTVYSGRLIGGYPLRSERVVITPTAGLSVTRSIQSAFDETSDGTTNAMRVGELASTSIRGSVGTSVARGFSLEGGKMLMPSASITFNHELNDAHNEGTMVNLSTGAVSSISSRLPANSVNLGIGLTGTNGSGDSLGLNVGAELRDGYQAVTVAATVKMTF